MMLVVMPILSVSIIVFAMQLAMFQVMQILMAILITATLVCGMIVIITAIATLLLVITVQQITVLIAVPKTVIVSQASFAILQVLAKQN
jgi:hypothetical protein